MKMKRFALLLVMVLCISSILPVTTRAVQENPLVLHTKKDSTGEYLYHYYGEGRVIVEEKTSGNTVEETSYYYEMGTLVSKIVSRNGERQEATFYDDFGTVMSIVRYDGDTAVQWLGYPEYDEYGRLISYTQKGPADMDYNLQEDYDVTRLRYEYPTDPVTLFFGHYEQDGNTQNGAEPIEWQVLETDGEKMLLVSKYALDCRVYHSRNTNISWEDSDLRDWLNGEFMEKAFTDSEHYLLRDVKRENSSWDWVFLLSQEEVEQYFPSDEARLCEASKYAVQRGAYVNKTTNGSWWLLRTPGTASQCVMSVNSDGTMDYDGGKVASKKGTVRPAVWVSVTAMRDNAQPAREHETYSVYGDTVVVTSMLRTYDAEGRLTCDQKTHSGDMMEMTMYSYDLFGNLYEELYVFESWQEGMEGNMSILKTYKNFYDQAGQLTRVEYHNADDPEEDQVITYTYNKVGQLTSRTTEMMQTNDTIKETWTYDRYGNMLQYSSNGTVQETNTYVLLSEVDEK